jgi:anti-sigma B factor antagonist
VGFGVPLVRTLTASRAPAFEFRLRRGFCGMWPPARTEMVSAPSARLWVLAGEKFACIRIVGRANFTSSIDFNTLVAELRQKAYSYFVIDLSECTLMDSTFLGVLAGFGIKLGGAQKEPEERSIELFKPNPRITELLENLGLLHLFKLTDGCLNLPETAEAKAHCPPNSSREDLLRACLEAHQALANINPENASKFKDVTQFLAKDLQKPKDGG